MMVKLSKLVLFALITTILFVVFFDKDYSLADIFLHETMPLYQSQISTDGDVPVNDSETVINNAGETISNKTWTNKTNTDDGAGYEKVPGLLSLSDIIYQPETSESKTRHQESKPIDISKLKDIDYLRTNFYTTDPSTEITAADFDAEAFLSADLHIDTSVDGPQVLIIHTHSTEMYADSNPSSMFDGVVGVGELLCDILNEQYGISAIHDLGRYDIVEGKAEIRGAYERMEPVIQSILDENPSIQMVIDLHRDGVNENIHLATEIDGESTARIMFVNGISKIKENGVLRELTSLPNEYLSTNLALSFNLQMKANSLYPNFARKGYINAYRYSLNMRPLSILVEVGAQTNTMREAHNAAAPLAEIIADVVLQ